MKKYLLLASIFIAFTFAGCKQTSITPDGSNSEVSIAVKHYKEMKAEYDGDTQINFDDNNQIKYQEMDVDIIKGITGSYTDVSAKNYEGFVALPFEQQFIKADEFTVVKIYYNRVSSKVSFDIAGGFWDYSTSKSDSATKSYTRKYGSEYPEIDFNKIGKRYCDFAGWKNSEGLLIPQSKFPYLTFGAEDQTYTAEWIPNGGVAYTVRYFFEKSDSADSTDFNSNYVTDDFIAKDELMYAEAGETTEVIAKNIEGFTLAKDIEQKTVAEDGYTVIEIFYKRNSYSIKLNAGSFEEKSACWNYQEYKNGGEKFCEPKEYSCKYGAVVNYDFNVQEAGVIGCYFAGWKNVKTNAVITELPETMVLDGAEFTAVWKKYPQVNYTIEHWLEKPTSTDSSNILNYDLQLSDQDNTGYPEQFTEAQSIDPEGFTAKSFEQVEIKADGSSKVKIYYTRNTVTVTLSAGEGYWNYTEWKKDKENVTPDSTNKIISGKYGTTFDATDKIKGAGKKSSGIEKWQIDDSDKFISQLPEEFPSANVTYTIIWSTSAEVNYKVEHWFEKTTCSDIADESSASYYNDKDYDQVLTGLPETNTTAVAKTIAGFDAKEVKQQEIAASGNTVVKIYYVRRSVDLVFNADDGLWNYDEYNLSGGTIAAKSGTKTISGKFGTKVPYSTEVNNFADLKKIGKNLAGFKLNDSLILIENLPTTFPSSNENYIASWTNKSAVSYSIKYMTENVDSLDDSEFSNYSLHSTDSSKKGTPDYYTEATAKEISGFTPKSIEQKQIKEDGSTEVFVMYKRNSYSITFDSNGGMWNYLNYKNNGDEPDSQNIVISGKYEMAVELPDQLNSIGKTSHNLNGWTKDNGSTVYQTSELIKKFTAADVTYKANWLIGSGIAYTVKHLLETEDGTNYVEDSTLTETGYGIKDQSTEAVTKSVTGFTAITPVEQQIINEDGTTVVKIKYTRNSYNFTFDANGGNLSGNSSIAGKFGTKLNKLDVPSVTKSGWTFGGWKLNGELVSDSNKQLADQTFTKDQTYVAYWITTSSVKTLSFFGDIVLNKFQDENSVSCSVTLPSGYEDSEWSYKWYVDGVYNSDESTFVRTNSALKKGVHTITLKATLNGNVFTSRVTATIE